MLKCRIVRSEPQEDGTFRTTLESDVPANSVTMHGDLWLVPVEEPVYTGDELRAAAAKLHLSGYLARVLVEIGEGGKW